MKERTVLIGLLCAGALCVGALQAQEAAGPKGKPERPDRARHIMGGDTNRFDRFAAIDTNTNGVISLDEFTVMHAKREAAMKQRMGDTYDATKAAARPSAEVVFKKFDTDGDGALTRQELDADRMPRGPRPPRGEGGKKPEAPAAGEVAKKPEAPAAAVVAP
jgi:hypothetical protein